MELARHHDADLTFGRYAHTRLEDLSKVVDKLPDLWEKCGKGNGLSVDPKSKAGMGDAIYQEPLTPDFPTPGLWEKKRGALFPRPSHIWCLIGTLWDHRKSSKTRSQSVPS
jgi:hypothetical protein